MKLTGETITHARIRTLRQTAEAAGDAVLVATCDVALGVERYTDLVPVTARTLCAEALNRAEEL